MMDNDTWLKPSAVLTLVVLVLAVYIQVGRHDFVSFDDGRYIYENPVVSQGITAQGLRWAFGFSDVAYWHPVTWLSHMLDCEFFGLDPGPPHLVNVFLHLCNTLLLLYLLATMTGAFWKSLFVAALFAVHPVNVESVAWLAERKNLLSTLFGISSLIAYVAFKRNRHFLNYIGALLLYMLGLMAKPALVVFPVLMLLLDFWPLRRPVLMDKPTSPTPKAESVEGRFIFHRDIWVEKVPFVILAVLTAVVASISMGLRGIDIALESVPLMNRLANGVISINGYIGKMIWPIDLVVFYPYPETISPFDLGLALIAVTGISTLAMTAYRKAPFLAFGWGWFLVALLPMIGIKQAGLWPALADRWAYVPYIGLFVATIWGYEKLFLEKGKRLNGTVIVVLVALAALSMITYRQVNRWQNSMTLFQHAVSVNPENDVAHNNLGAAFYRSGQVEKALYHFVKALIIQPGFQDAHENLDTCLVRLGYGQNLTAKIQQLIDANPGIPALYFHLGNLLEKQGDFQGAGESYESALNMRPDFVQALNSLCRVLMIQKDYAKALVMLTRRAAIKPVNAAVFYDIARIYAHSGDADQALRWLTRSMEKGFDNWEMIDRDAMFDNLRKNEAFQNLRNS